MGLIEQIIDDGSGDASNNGGRLENEGRCGNDEQANKGKKGTEK